MVHDRVEELSMPVGVFRIEEQLEVGLSRLGLMAESMSALQHKLFEEHRMIGHQHTSEHHMMVLNMLVEHHRMVLSMSWEPSMMLQGMLEQRRALEKSTSERKVELEVR